MKLAIAAASTVLSASTTTLTTAEKVGLAAPIERIGVPEAAAEAGAASAGHEHKATRFGRLVECTPTPRSSGDQAEEGTDLGILGCPDSNQVCLQDAESSLGGVCKSVVSRDLMPTPTTPTTPKVKTQFTSSACARVRQQGCSYNSHDGHNLHDATVCLSYCPLDSDCQNARACFVQMEDLVSCLKAGYWHDGYSKLCISSSACKKFCERFTAWTCPKWDALLEGYSEGKHVAETECPSQVDTGHSKGFEAGKAKGTLACQSQISTMCKSKSCAETETMFCPSSHSTNPEVFDATKKIRG